MGRQKFKQVGETAGCKGIHGRFCSFTFVAWDVCTRTLPCFVIYTDSIDFLLFSQLAQTIKDENGDGDIVYVDDGSETSLPDSELSLFEKFLPVKDKNVIDPFLTTFRT